MALSIRHGRAEGENVRRLSRRTLMITIDTSSFTPWPALGGGVLIGLAAGWLALSVGRIAGVSGIVGGLLEPRTGQGRADQTWRLAFVLGLVASPWVYTWLVA